MLTELATRWPMCGSCFGHSLRNEEFFRFSCFDEIVLARAWMPCILCRWALLKRSIFREIYTVGQSRDYVRRNMRDLIQKPWSAVDAGRNCIRFCIGTEWAPLKSTYREFFRLFPERPEMAFWMCYVRLANVRWMLEMAMECRPHCGPPSKENWKHCDC